MNFSSIIGQEMAINLLQQELKQKRIAHAYLFCGPEGSGKKRAALAFARTILCQQQGIQPCESCRTCLQTAALNYPDLSFLSPEGESLKIEQVRHWQQEQAYQPYWGKWKVSIIESAEKMTSAAANSILKIVEEPGPGTVFILLAEGVEWVLPTIVSRCQVISFKPLTQNQISFYLNSAYPELGQGEREVLAQLSGGSIRKADQLVEEGNAVTKYEQAAEVLNFLVQQDEFRLFSLAKKFEQRNEQLWEYLDLLSSFFRDLLLWKATGLVELVWNKKIVVQYGTSFENRPLQWFINCLKTINQTKIFLKQNTNIQLTLEVMFLKLGQNMISS